VVSGVVCVRNVRIRQLYYPYMHLHSLYLFSTLIYSLSLTFVQRNYHARKKSSGSSRSPNTYVMPTRTLQDTASSSQQPLATATAPEGPPTVVATAVATVTSSHSDIIITHAGWWTRFLLWIGCVSFQHTDGQH
jgi:hypothetical protein